LGGYETAASTLSWLLFEIAKHPGQQERIREEYRRTLAENHGELSVNDYDQMEYLNAVIKAGFKPFLTFFLCNILIENHRKLYVSILSSHP
jgi:hypothetical protein